MESFAIRLGSAERGYVVYGTYGEPEVMSQLSTAERHQGNVVILDVDGRLTLGEASLMLRDSIAAIVDKGSKKILANLKGVGYIDSSGLGELVTAFAMAQRHGAV